jgi:hypothetical protein
MDWKRVSFRPPPCGVGHDDHRHRPASFDDSLRDPLAKVIECNNLI